MIVLFKNSGKSLALLLYFKHLVYVLKCYYDINKSVFSYEKILTYFNKKRALSFNALIIIWICLSRVLLFHQ